MSGKTIVWAVGLIMCACLAILLFWNSSLEDPFISFRYAQHLAQGEGLRWNLGEPPLEGYTNFLWVSALSVPASLGLDLMLVGKLIGSILFVLLLLQLYRIGLVLGLDAWISGATSLLLVLVPAWPFYAASGLESLLFTVLVFYALWFHLCEIDHGRFPHGSALFCLAASLTRPEGLGVWGLILVLKIIADGKIGKRVALWSLIYLAPLSLYLIWKQLYFGSMIPLPFFAKHTGGGIYLLFSGGIYVAGFVAGFAGPAILLVALLWSGGAKVGADNGGVLRRDPRFQLLTFTMLYPLYLLGTGGDVAAAFPSFRLLLPLGPALVLLLLHALSVNPDRSLIRRGILILVAVNLFSGLVQTEELVIFTRKINNYNGVSSRLFRIPGPPPIADFLINDAASRGLQAPSIAVLAAGQIPYYSGFRAYDRLGLNDPVVAHSPKRQRGLDTKFNTEHLLSLAPNYIQTNISYHEVLAGEISPQWRLADQELWESELFRARYELLTGAPDKRAFFVLKESDPR